MSRDFNTAGPCRPGFDYMLPPSRRLPGIRELIDKQRYFVVHAPRQVGKSTAMLTLGDDLTAEGKYASVMLSVEAGVPFADLDRAVPAILGAWRDRAENRLPAELWPPPWPDADVATALGGALRAWARTCPRPLAIFLDEVDSLAPDVLGSLLRQLRDRYNDRPNAFPASIALVGMRDVKDDVVAAGGTGQSGAGSPFNILAGSLTMRNFTHDEIAELYAQHTADTGQRFDGAAVDRAWELSRGQPWLVNALAREATNTLVPQRTLPVRVHDIDNAKESLIRRNDTHLQSLGSRLREDRVRRIIEPLMAGGTLPVVSEDDLQYAQDLGLVRVDPQVGLTIANPIYADAFPRALAAGLELGLPGPTGHWVDAHGDLDTERLLAGFLAFWRQHGQPLLAASPYHEIAPHLVLMAWLHRVCNGGGSLDREYAIGSGRMDLCLRLGKVTLGIELKVWRDGREDPLSEGVPQLDAYLSRLPAAKGWLVIFDRRTPRPGRRKRKALPEHLLHASSESLTSPAGHTVVVVRA